MKKPKYEKPEIKVITDPKNQLTIETKYELLKQTVEEAVGLLELDGLGTKQKVKAALKNALEVLG